MKKKVQFFSFIFLSSFVSLSAQCWNLVWEEEFNGSSLDLSNWSYQIGGNGWGNSELQYYTNGDNVTVSNGTLKIRAEEDATNNYPDNGYTSSRIRSQHKADWKYGKMEARVKMPEGQGLWPAFWMMPTHSVYGGWPSSGEIDIIEYLGHDTNTAYGFSHYGNSPVDKSSSGSAINLSSGTYSATFHTFGIEWEPGEIRWYLDGTLYHTLNSNHSDFNTYNWPFDQEFHFILNLAVGGNWPGAPDGTTVFPQEFEVDWVRVYQKLSDLTIEGSVMEEPGATAVSYSVPDMPGAIYVWFVPFDAVITSGQGTANIDVTWASSGGDVSVTIITGCATATPTLAVDITPNLWANYGFEDGWDNWNSNEFNGAAADFNIVTSNPQEETYSMVVMTTNLATNVWDIQMARTDVELDNGEDYTISFWAKADQNGKDANLAIINSSTFVYYLGNVFTLTDSWANYTYSFTAPTGDTTLFNFDLGDELGTFSFDNFSFARTALLPVIYTDFWLTRSKNNSINIHWITELEDQLDHFKVQKSTDRHNWQIIGIVDKRSNDYNYITIDNHPIFGENYYRIISVDYDGTEQYSVIRSIRVEKESITVYPNPAREVLYLQGTNIELVEIYDLVGNLLIENHGEVDQVDLSRLPSGKYYLSIQQNGVLQNIEVVKL